MMELVNDGWKWLDIAGNGLEWMEIAGIGWKLLIVNLTKTSKLWRGVIFHTKVNFHYHEPDKSGKQFTLLMSMLKVISGISLKF